MSYYDIIHMLRQDIRQRDRQITSLQARNVKLEKVLKAAVKAWSNYYDCYHIDATLMERLNEAIKEAEG